MRRSPHILIVDDDPDDRQMFVEQLRCWNTDLTIQCLNSGDQALKYFKTCAPADLPLLILVDYQMPGLLGPAFLQAIQHNSDYDGIIKIVWSTSGAKEYVDNCMQRGADKYFVKPCNIAELDKIITYITKIIQSRLAASECY